MLLSVFHSNVHELGIFGLFGGSKNERGVCGSILWLVFVDGLFHVSSRSFEVESQLLTYSQSHLYLELVDDRMEMGKRTNQSHRPLSDVSRRSVNWAQLPGGWSWTDGWELSEARTYRAGSFELVQRRSHGGWSWSIESEIDRLIER
jgi:hypothetical protein